MIFECRFAGRHAVVTGGASGIGAAIAERLRAEGAEVTIWDLAPEGGGIDVTDADRVAAAAAEAAEAMGGIDILVASAGITGPQHPVVGFPVDTWRRVLEVNLTGTFLTNRAVVPVMQRAGYGRVVNMASIAGKEGNATHAAYSAAKAGVIALTKSLGKELATAGVTVNAIAPAAVETAIFAQMSPAYTEAVKAKIPMGRFGRVEEIAALACWLASDEASFTTGAVFDQSGGRATY